MYVSDGFGGAVLDQGDWGVGAVWVWDGEDGGVGWDSGGDYCGV